VTLSVRVARCCDEQKIKTGIRALESVIPIGRVLVKAHTSKRQLSRSRQLRKIKALALTQVTDGSLVLSEMLKC